MGKSFVISLGTQLASSRVSPSQIDKGVQFKGKGPQEPQPRSTSSGSKGLCEAAARQLRSAFQSVAPHSALSCQKLHERSDPNAKPKNDQRRAFRSIPRIWACLLTGPCKQWAFARSMSLLPGGRCLGGFPISMRTHMHWENQRLSPCIRRSVQPVPPRPTIKTSVAGFRGHLPTGATVAFNRPSTGTPRPHTRFSGPPDERPRIFGSRATERQCSEEVPTAPAGACPS